MPVLETERRKNHIDLIDPSHALLPIAMDCLKYQERERPSSEELCQRLAGLKDSSHYKDDVEIKQQLEEQEQVTTEIQQTKHSLQRQVEQLQQQLSQQIQSENPAHKRFSPKDRKTTLTWRDGGKAPFEMTRGAAVDHKNVTYFMHYYGRVFSYKSTDKKWSVLPKYPYKGSSLAVINGQLTGIGGCDDCFAYTNKLLSLCERESWSDVFPPMPTKRLGTFAVMSKEHLIVAGGTTGPYSEDNLNTVEVMDTKTLVWSTVASLPHPYNWASSTICGDHLYMLGGWDDNDKTKSVLTCSLTELLQSSSSSSSVWHRVADAPAYHSTCAAVNGELLAVGGCDENSKATSAIHKYNPTTNSWDLINNMPTARYSNLVAVLPTNEVMVVGGWLSGLAKTDIVEFASF